MIWIFTSYIWDHGERKVIYIRKEWLEGILVNYSYCCIMNVSKEFVGIDEKVYIWG